jgi:NADPH2:quinone reductase
MKAVRVSEVGGVEKLTYTDVDVPKPGPGQALVKVAAAGVNYIDTYHRSGLYKLPLPFTLGLEGAGVVESVADDVTDFKPGDHVTWASGLGSYAEYVLVSTSQLVRVFAGMKLEDAAAAMLQGMTAHYLTHSTWPLKQGETCLVHAPAGGTGRLICQMAKMRGARVIGVTSTEEKAKIAREAGADEVILYKTQDFEEETKRLTGGAGVDVVYDSIGANTFEKSLKCVRRRGLMVTFGNASGPVPPLQPLALSNQGSIYLTRPKLGDYTVTSDELRQRAGDVLEWVATGRLKLKIDKTYPLSEAQQAHRDLESGKTSGKLMLKP